MTARRAGLLGLVAIGIVIVVIFSLQWLTSGGVAITSEPGASAPVTRSPAGLPDPKLTPGAINPAATQDNLDATVCKPGWAKSVRPPSAYTAALKVAQILEYGYADKDPRHYQEDHLVPLELGGASRDHRNLWPQPETATLPDGTTVGWKEKDDLEDLLHDQVCDDVVTLADAQLRIARDWVAAWVALGRP